MYRITSMLAVMFLLGTCQLASGVTITFDEFPADNSNGSMPSSRYNYLGVTISGTDDGSTLGGLSNGNPGNWGLEGTNGPFFSGFNGSSYTNTLTLISGGSIYSFSLDVSRSNGSADTNTFTIEGYTNNVLTESVTVPLHTINEWTTVSLNSVVDEVKWFGTGSGFHPFGVDNLNFQIPEPTGLGMLLAGSLLLMRRK